MTYETLDREWRFWYREDLEEISRQRGYGGSICKMVVELYRQGLSTREIGKICDNRSGVWAGRVLEYAGEPRRPRGGSNNELGACIQGMTIAQCAEKIGLPYELVRNRYSRGWTESEIMTPYRLRRNQRRYGKIGVNYDRLEAH